VIKWKQMSYWEKPSEDGLGFEGEMEQWPQAASSRENGKNLSPMEQIFNSVSALFFCRCCWNMRNLGQRHARCYVEFGGFDRGRNLPPEMY